MSSSPGRSVVDSQRYDPSQVDFADTIRTVMQVRPAKLDHKLEKGEKPIRPRIAATPPSSSWLELAGPARLILRS